MDLLNSPSEMFSSLDNRKRTDTDPRHGTNAFAITVCTETVDRHKTTMTLRCMACSITNNQMCAQSILLNHEIELIKESMRCIHHSTVRADNGLLSEQLRKPRDVYGMRTFGDGCICICEEECTSIVYRC